MDNWIVSARRQLLPESFLRFEFFRSSGPGGQKKNKTSSAVRITHEPTGVCAIATESRSQKENRDRAKKRLCHTLTLQYRLPIGQRTGEINLHVSSKNPAYLEVMGLVLDHLHASGWAVADAARGVGVSTGQLVDFLQKDDDLWQHVNRERAKLGLRPLI